MPVKSRFRGVFHNKHAMGAQRLLKSGQRYLSHVCSSLWTEFSRKKSMLVLCKFLRLLVKTLTDDEKYSLLYRKNLTQPIQILLSQKPKTFSRLFSEIFKPTLNFEHLQKKHDPHSRCSSQITISEKGD